MNGQVYLDFTNNGVVVVETDRKKFAWSFCGDGDVATLDFTAGIGNVASDLSGQTGTFGGGTMVLEATNLNYDEIGVSESSWKTNTNGGYWVAVSIGGSPYSITDSDTSWADAPFRFLRFRLTGATAPRIKGKGFIGEGK